MKITAPDHPTTRVDMSEGCERRCFRSDHVIAREVIQRRNAADAKHGDESIERIAWNDPRWISILGEEFGEVCHALTYDSGASVADLRDELMDVLAVAHAWVDAIRVAEAAS